MGARFGDGNAASVLTRLSGLPICRSRFRGDFGLETKVGQQRSTLSIARERDLGQRDAKNELGLSDANKNVKSKELTLSDLTLTLSDCCLTLSDCCLTG
jgi:hypothetical protein